MSATYGSSTPITLLERREKPSSMGTLSAARRALPPMDISAMRIEA